MKGQDNAIMRQRPITVFRFFMYEIHNIHLNFFVKKKLNIKLFFFILQRKNEQKIAKKNFFSSLK